MRGGAGPVLALLACALAAHPGRPQTVPPRTEAMAAGDVRLTGVLRQGALVRGEVPAGTRAVRLDGAAVAVAGDGRFVIAFDRDAAPDAVLEVETADGRVVRRPLRIARGDWRIEHVDASPTGGRGSAAFQQVRAGELAEIAAARAVDGGADGWRQRFAWPVRGRLSGLFGAQRVYRGQPGSFHSGADVAAPTGTPLTAPADGVVVLATARPFSLEGNLVIVDHGMGLNSAFLHLSRIDVVAGQRVRQGEQLGAVGATGRASGPHMHWSLKWRDARIDPLLVAGPVG